MGKIAFVFSGQGDQKTGMGLGLYEQSPAAKAVFDELDAVRPGTKEQCFYADNAELSLTANTQPCLFAVETAISAALKEAGICADMTAGFSLGELSALSFAGVLSEKEMFSLVIKRAALMSDAASREPAAMAAVLKLSADSVKELCSQLEGVYPVNFNCPGQISVSGRVDSMEELSASVKAAGGRLVPLKVSGGFHSPFMHSAAGGFYEELKKTAFNEPRIPVYADLTAEPYGADGRSTAEMLSKQIESPVLWENIIRAMISEGAETFIEIGPGETLSGMIKRIDKTVRTYSAGDPSKIEEIKSAIKER